MICINKSFIGPENSTYIIAEIGINHNGSIDKAKKLIDKAFDCGASAVKLQTYITEKRTYKGSPIFDILKQCEIGFDDQYKLFDELFVSGTQRQKSSVKRSICWRNDFKIRAISNYENYLNQMILQILIL